MVVALPREWVGATDLVRAGCGHQFSGYLLPSAPYGAPAFSHNSSSARGRRGHCPPNTQTARPPRGWAGFSWALVAVKWNLVRQTWAHPWSPVCWMDWPGSSSEHTSSLSCSGTLHTLFFHSWATGSQCPHLSLRMSVSSSQDGPHSDALPWLAGVTFLQSEESRGCTTPRLVGSACPLPSPAALLSFSDLERELSRDGAQRRREQAQFCRPPSWAPPDPGPLRTSCFL